MKQFSANIHPGAKIGANVEIEPFTTIHKNVEIGDGTWIGTNVTIMDGARIGKNCKIFPGAIIGAAPQAISYSGEETTVEIGDNVIVREFATLNRGTVASYKTVIGDNCLLMAYTHVAHDCQVGNNVILANAVNLGGHCIIGNYAIVGGLVGVHQFVQIGAHSIISAGVIVFKDVPPYVKAGHNPLAYAGINSVGLRRRGFSNEQINQIQDIYRAIFLKKMNVSQAVAYIKTELPPTKEKEEIVDFIKNAKRGIIKRYSSGGQEARNYK